MNKSKIIVIGLILVVLAAIAIFRSQPAKSAAAAGFSPKPALNVNLVRPLTKQVPILLRANGAIAAWQEAIIGAEVAELKLQEVKAQVGDKVHKGQILALFTDESVQTDLAQSRAAVAEAEANLTSAGFNAEHAALVAGSGVLSNQQIQQYYASEKAAAAKLQSAKAQLDAQLLRLKYTKVLASDDGVISARNATIGAVASKGQELFRLIVQNRLELRAEVTAGEIVRIKPGLPVRVSVPELGTINGTVRTPGPILDTQTRNGLVYVDLPNAATKGFRAGMFASCEFDLGSSPALTIPQEALSLREGFSYVFRVEQPQDGVATVSQLKVSLGRRDGDDLEILSGIQPNDQLVASGATFLSDGDRVRLVQP